MNQAEFSLWFTIFALAVDFVIRVVAIIVVPRNRRPSSALGWLLAIFFIPYIGVILFLLIGSPRLGRKRRRRQREINQFILDSTEGFDKVKHSKTWPAWLDRVVELNRNLGAMPLVGGNSAHMQIDYEKNIADIAADIDKAKNFVHVEFYILSSDTVTEPVFQAMQRAVERGVEVRVLFDHVAAMRTVGYRKTKKRLTKIGVDWHLMLPFLPFQGKYERPDLRNHRKLVIIDGVIGWMGSQNLIDSSYLKKSNIKRGLHWKDAMVRLQGPIVAGLNAIFITDWYSETDVLLTREAEPIDAFHEDHTLDCQIVPSGPGFASENNLRLFLTLMYSAQEKIIITSPYFVPDESLMYAITSACQRGVRVELFVSEIGDQALVYHAQRSYYEALLRAGVIIWLYKAPTILHSKHMSIDDEVAVIGSSNMDMRSFSLNLEVSLMVRGTSFVKQMRHVEDAYRDMSRALTLEEWKKQPLRSTVLDGLARLTLFPAIGEPMAYEAASTRYDIMNYRKSGKWGLKLPEISLGLWHNFGDEGSLKNQRAILRRAFDLGVTHFDLANNYGVPAGSAESHFGEVLATDFKPYRDEMVISSKAGYFMWDGPYGEWGSRKYLMSSLDQSLSRMGLDYVDIFYSHRPDPNTPIEETMGALASIVQQGKALYVGISSYTPEQTLAAKKELDRLGVPLLIHQPRYSMFDRTIERSGLLYTLDEIGAGCIVFSPLSQGMLTDRYLKGIPKDSRAALGVHLGAERISEEYLERVRGLSAIAEARGQTLAQMALLWTLRNPGVTSALIGASSVKQLEDNIAAIHGPDFEPEELEAIDVFAVHGTDSGSHRKS